MVSEVIRAALASAALCALAPAAAQAVAPADILVLVNQQRAQNGLPADVRERADWDEACRKHNDYQSAHGKNLSHDEADTASPASSPEGAFAAANSVLADEDTWTAAGPWYDAPIHRHQFYTPLLAETGVDDHDGLQCAIVDPGYTRAVPVGQVFTFPGDAVTGVPAREIANEEPFSPSQFTGIATGTPTGPNLLVFTGTGPVKILAASLTGSDGAAVEVRYLDNTTRDVGEYITPGGILVPVQPLRDGLQYAASVTLSVGGKTFTHTWGFGIGNAAAPAPSAKTVAGAAPAATSAACKKARTKATSARKALTKARALLRKKRTTKRRSRVLSLQRKSRAADRARVKACGR